MIKYGPIFQVNFLKKSIIIQARDDVAVCGALLDRRRKVKINFPTTKKKTALLTGSPIDKEHYFFNLNKTIYQTNIDRRRNYITAKKYPPRLKIKWKFKKFKYRGKGFKIKKFNKLSKITFKMGKSHWTKALFNKKVITVKRTKKNTYTCITIKNKGLDGLGHILMRAKGVNKYTKRGVRLTRQRIKKRFGKISQASSVYK